MDNVNNVNNLNDYLKTLELEDSVNNNNSNIVQNTSIFLISLEIYFLIRVILMLILQTHRGFLWKIGTLLIIL